MGKSSYINYHFPPGIGDKAPPYFGIDINAHFLNYTGNNSIGQIYGNIYFAEPEEIQHNAKIFMLNNSDIVLPPNQTTSINKLFMYPLEHLGVMNPNGTQASL